MRVRTNVLQTVALFLRQHGVKDVNLKYRMSVPPIVFRAHRMTAMVDLFMLSSISA